MTTISRLSAVILGTALAFVPVLGMAQQGSAQPETAIPRQAKGPAGHGGFAPPRDAKPIPPPHGTVQAHSTQPKQSQDSKKAKSRNTGAAAAANPK